MTALTSIEIAAAVTGVIAVWLTTRQHSWCWPLGLVYVVLSGILLFEARLYADMALQGVYGVLSVYGWWHWLRGGTDGGVLGVSRLPRRSILLLASAAIVGTVAIGWGLASLTNAAVPFWDALTTSVCLVAQWMVTRKWVENWLVWIAVDAVLVPKYLHANLYLYALLYVAYLLLAVSGWLSWRRSLAEASQR